MSIKHNRIKVSDLEANEPNKILITNQNGELEFSDFTNVSNEFRKENFEFTGSKIFVLSQPAINVLSVVVDGITLNGTAGAPLQYRMNTPTQLEILDEMILEEDIWVSITYNYTGSINSTNGVQSVTGEGVDNTDPQNPVIRINAGAIIEDQIVDGVTNKGASQNAIFDALSLKVDKATGKSLLSDTEITRLGTLSNYTHPANHPASIITQDPSNRFVTDTEKATWNAKQANITAGTNAQYFRGDKSWQTLDKTAVGLTNVDNTADAAKNVLSATKLTTARTINGVSFDGSANITINAVDSTPRIASSEKGAANGVATLDASGIILTSQLPSYVDDVLEYTNLAGFPATGEAGKIYVAKDTNKTYRWSGTAYVFITSGAVDSVAGKTGVVTLAKADVGLASVDNTADAAKNVLSATKLTTARTINGVAFDGSANVTITDSTKENSITAGTTAQYYRGDKTWQTLDKTAAGLGSVDNTADAAKNVLSATKLTTARTINGVAFDGTANITVADATKQATGATFFVGTTSIANNRASASQALTGVSIDGNAGSATILQTSRTINGVAFNGSANITINAVDATTRIASSEKGAANGVATLDASGIILTSQLPSYVDDVLEFTNLAGFPATGEAGKIYVAKDTNKTYRWSGTAYVYITSGAVDSVAGKTGVVTLAKADVGLASVDNTADAAKNVLSATKLTTARTINGVAFDGSANVTITDSTKENSITAGTTAQYFRGDKTWQTLDKTAAGLGSVDNTADAAKNVLSATKLTTARTINGVAFDGTANITVADATKQATGATFFVGTTSIANNRASASQTLTGISVDGNSATATTLQTSRTINGVAFNGSANITINAVDATTRIASSEKGAANGVATLDASGIILTSQLPSYVDDVLEFTNLAGFPTTGETGKIYVAKDTNKTYRWSGTAYVYITSGAVDSVAGKTGVVTLVKADVGLASVDNTADTAKNVLSATKLTTARTINGVAFDGSANITISDSTKENSITAGSASQYFRGDKTWQTLDKTAAGLGSVDNTADAAKNVLSATKLTTARTINGVAFDGTSNITIADATKLPLAGGTMQGDIVFPGTDRSEGVFGTYDSTKTQSIWSMGTAYRNSVDGSNFGTLYGFGYKHTNNVTGGTMAGGHQAVWCQAGVPKASLGDGIWTIGAITGASFNGLGTGLTGTATGLNIGGSAGSAKYVDLLPNRTDVAAYPILWGVNQGTNPVTGNASTYAFSCDAVKIQSSTGTVIANNFSGSGSGLTGTAGSLSIGGSAATATSAVSANSATRISFVDGPRTLSDRLPNSFARTVNFDFVNAAIVGGSGNYGGVMTFAPWDGLSTSTGDSSYQLAFRNESGVNGSGLPGLRLRKGIDTTWAGWYDMLHSGNYASYSAFSGAITGASVTVTGDVTAFSDARVKENIRPITNVIEKIQASRGVVYDRIDTKQKDNIGFIAQELEENFPELVLTREDGTKAVKYQNAVAVLFEAIKEQQSQIEELKGLVTKLLKP